MNENGGETEVKKGQIMLHFNSTGNFLKNAPFFFLFLMSIFTWDPTWMNLLPSHTGNLIQSNFTIQLYHNDYARHIAIKY